MNLPNITYNQILNVVPKDFDALALDIFHYQRQTNALYGEFLEHLSFDSASVEQIGQIPFLPIQMWKHHMIKSGKWATQKVFESSGTTGQVTSKHAVKSMDWYHKVSDRCFEKFFGSSKNYCWLGLLPSYLERNNSSLVAMVDHNVKQSKYSNSGFFLDDFEALADALRMQEKARQPTILIGVSFGLLDFLESDMWSNDPFELRHTMVFETGGMKGRREELTKAALHDRLQNGFGIPTVHSEYGMTELLSQSYTKGGLVYYPGPTKKILIGDESDPLSLQKQGKRGPIRVIDLANVDTCSFIATEDLGIGHPDGSFEIIGRQDISDLRGCSLMIDDI